LLGSIGCFENINNRHVDFRSDSGEVVTPSQKSREEGVITSKEITPSPHKDGYQWRKYGQKRIQNCNFSR
jgi:hypothetical protein